MVAKYIRIERMVSSNAGEDKVLWRSIPGCERVELWGLCFSEAAIDQHDAGSKLFHFHIPASKGISRGCRVTYMGQHYGIRSIADSQKLRGIELGCILQNG